jgi:hypothetical protein
LIYITGYNSLSMSNDGISNYFIHKMNVRDDYILIKIASYRPVAI